MNEPRDNHSAPDAATPALRERVRALRLPERTTGGAPGSGLIRVLLLFTLSLLVVVSYVGYEAHATRTQLRDLLADPAAVLGEAMKAAPAGAAGEERALRGTDAVASSGAVALERSGFVIAAHLILVSPKVGGMVTKLSIEEGQRVHKGEILAELETVDYQADRDRAKAGLDMVKEKLRELEAGHRPEEIQQAKAELDEMEAQREQLYLDWKRNRDLRVTNALANRDYEQAAGSYKAMDRRVERLKQAHKLMVDGPRVERIQIARADVRQAEADLVKAQWRLDNCKITAPVTGTILSKKAEEGNMVNPAAFSNGLSASLCEMADLSDLEVDLSIEERDVAKVFKGQRCKARPDAYPERAYEGEVSRLMPQADRAKGAIPVRVKLIVAREEEGVYLKPDMRVQVSFLKKK